MSVRRKSDYDPVDEVSFARAAADVWRTAHAVGLVDEMPEAGEVTYQQVKRTVLCVREAGIAERATAEIAGAGPEDATFLAGRLREILEQLEQSPLPDTEWHRVLKIVDRDRLAALLGVSPASVARYASQERRTPDDIAARLHFLALVIGDLAGAYNEIGIRRWFERTRTALDGRTPAKLLRGNWQPEDPGPRAVRELARSLVASPAT